MSLKNVMVAQSGGPTVAINASLAGVIRGVMASDQYETVYGSVNGILGILNNHLLNLTEIMNENPAYLDRLETTPAMYLGSCRHKLPDYLDDIPHMFLSSNSLNYTMSAPSLHWRKRLYGHRFKII